jgi:hypothetical protein
VSIGLCGKPDQRPLLSLSYVSRMSKVNHPSPQQLAKNHGTETACVGSRSLASRTGQTGTQLHSGLRYGIPVERRRNSAYSPALWSRPSGVSSGFARPAAPAAVKTKVHSVQHSRAGRTRLRALSFCFVHMSARLAPQLLGPTAAIVPGTRLHQKQSVCRHLPLRHNVTGQRIDAAVVNKALVSRVLTSGSEVVYTTGEAVVLRFSRKQRG